MGLRLTADAKGVYVIAATPFQDDGSIDEASIDSLTAYYLDAGVSGLTILGVMGEAQKLSESESLAVARRFINAVQGRVPVVVGVTNPGTPNLVRLAHSAMAEGAGGVMIQPLSGLRTNEAVKGYFGGVIEALGPDVPVVVQDYPQLTGVNFSATTFIEMVDAHPSIVCFKHEEWPGLRKLSEIRAACDGSAHRYISILCGNGGLHLPQEYRRGADGAMTGFAFPEMMVGIDKLFRAGKPEEAEDLFDIYLPILRHEFQIGLGLALRKEVLRRRGAIKSSAVRAPGPKLDTRDIAELDALLARLHRKLRT
ncbi:MAG TPA: dihydrodipicolinate synthase family protein [Hyphomicrobiaceae bacterium]|nr:dihydrodipicolinate synthase family protein [Hyphomicrobiaceae bacterium]